LEPKFNDSSVLIQFGISVDENYPVFLFETGNSIVETDLVKFSDFLPSTIQEIYFNWTTADEPISVTFGTNLSRFKFQSYRVFHGFGQVRFGQPKFAACGLILGSSQLSQLSELPQKMTLNLKVIKID